MPFWYSISWLTKTSRYILIYFIFTSYNWWSALLCLLIPIIYLTFMSIPHLHFLPLFRRKLLKEKENLDLILYQELNDAIDRVETFCLS